MKGMIRKSGNVHDFTVQRGKLATFFPVRNTTRIEKGGFMSFTFSPYEIAEKAMSIEEEGAKFYHALSNLTDNHVLKDIFDTLSKEEVEHRKKFSEIAVKHLMEETTEHDIDIPTLVQDYANDIKDAFKATFSVQTIEDALNIAINLEETAIRIYEAMQVSLSQSVQDILEEIVNEEKKHLDILMEAKAQQSKIEYE
jgi:rubrerythrin